MKPEALRRRADVLGARSAIVVVRDPPPPPPPAPGQPPIVPGNPAEGVEVLLALWGDGDATGFHGHVDLGTGIRTALAQIVAEELHLPMERVSMVLGSTGIAPNQGPTIASASIQIHAVPLQQAAAQIKALLMARAGVRLNAGVAELVAENGIIRRRDDPARSVDYAALVAEGRAELRLDAEVPVKPRDQYTIVGTSPPRVDIPAKVFGGLTFVHDMRLPGMLHGRVVRPPYAGADHGDYIGNTLEGVDEASIAHIPGVRAIVVIRDFIGIVAEREEQAERAAEALVVRWKPWPGMPPLNDLGEAISANPATQRRLVDDGDVEGAIASAADALKRRYVWPYQMHASIGPSCAVADWHGAEAGGTALTVYAGTQNPHVLRLDLARLLGLTDVAVDIVRMEAAGCYGRNCADDVAADAALLSRAVGAPVRVQLTREQEHLWEPKGAAQLMEVNGGIAADGSIAAYDFSTSYPSNGAPTLALLLTRVVDPVPQAFAMGDRTARPPYRVENLRVTVNDMPPILRASWLRGVSALPNSFAHESYIDELATRAGVDPVAYRLQHLEDPRAAELLQETAMRAGWKTHTKPRQQAADGDWLKGQGVAYARYVHSKWPGFGAAYSAWVADVDVNRVTGEVHVARVVVGHDAGLMINPDGVRHQIHGNVVQTTSRALTEQVRVDPETSVVAAREWGSYPIVSFRQVPVIEVMTMPRNDQPPLGSGESSSVPGTAAIANAIFDATGVRFRQPPFTPEVVRAGLAAHGALAAPVQAEVARFRPAAEPAVDAIWPRAKPWLARAAGLVVGAASLAGAVLGWRSAIAPVAPGSAAIYTDAVIEQGRVLASLGNCVGCHTAEGGLPMAGGRAMHTPFGTVYTTNLTPDPVHGIGQWSFSAFQRAMREGISRDGRHLYPAFPYTSFARLTDADLTALYAYMMAQVPISAAPPQTRLAAPFGFRPLMSLWNALYHTPDARPVADASRSAVWNRGAYLVQGLGHCGACHTERDALGAERTGNAAYGGAVIDGWEAPALTALARGPVPWTEASLYQYLRRGYSDHHGVASGPMAQIVRELGAAPDDDIRAMAHYLASFSAPVADTETLRTQAIGRSQQAATTLMGESQRMFETACGACHHDGAGPRVLGVNVPLALNSNLHSDRPDNLIRILLEGISKPPGNETGFMPSFARAFDDRQLADLVRYMRARFAPDKPVWTNIDASIAALRAARH